MWTLLIYALRLLGRTSDVAAYAAAGNPELRNRPWITTLPARWRLANADQSLDMASCVAGALLKRYTQVPRQHPFGLETSSALVENRRCRIFVRSGYLRNYLRVDHANGRLDPRGSENASPRP